MGAGLIQNEDRIAKLESRLKNIDGYCKNCNEAKIKSVFFEKNNYVEKKQKEKNDEDKINADKEKYELDERKKIENENNVFDEKKNEYKKKTESENDVFDEKEKEKQEKKIGKTKNKKTDDNLQTYTVKDGDSLSLISQKFFGSTKMINEILKLNGMDDANKIYSGKVLKLPK